MRRGRSEGNRAPGCGNRNATPTQHVNPNGPLNAWVALDASVKQYSYAAGMDLQTAVPLDAQALLNAAQSGATVNEQEGWVQNLNQTAIQNQLTSYQNQLKTYIDTQKPNATVGDVIGRKIIPQTVHSVLAGVTPLALVQSGQQAAAVPSSLQHQFSYTLSDNWGNELLSYTAPTSQLGGKRITLSYAPASQADTDLIASYLPKPPACPTACSTQLPTPCAAGALCAKSPSPGSTWTSAMCATLPGPRTTTRRSGWRTTGCGPVHERAGACGARAVLQ